MGGSPPTTLQFDDGGGKRKTHDRRAEQTRHGSRRGM
jgi:hypothetical protein